MSLVTPSLLQVSVMIAELNVVPFQGLLPIRLGMTDTEVIAVSGVSWPISGYSPHGDRCGFFVVPGQWLEVVFIEGRASEITVSPGPLPVRLRGVDLLRAGNERAALRILLTAQPDPRLSYGVLVFHELGIAASGLHEEDVPNKAISVFTENYWGDVSRLPPADLSVPSQIPIGIRPELRERKRGHISTDHSKG